MPVARTRQHCDQAQVHKWSTFHTTMVSSSTPLPSPEQLIKDHASYMQRLPATERERSAALTASLNMAALHAVVKAAVGSVCHRIDKIYEGGFNQIYNLTFDDETLHVIARINMPFGGGSLAPENERRIRVRSEAATLRWLRENTTIPVPKVFAFDENFNNEVGAAYIIEEKILGRTLYDTWCSMKFEARTAIVKQLADFETQMLATSFSMIGSLDVVDSDFVVGPLAPAMEVEAPRVRRGPWTNSREDMQEFILDQLEEIKYNPERIISRRHYNKVEVSPVILKEFEELYSAISRLIEDVKLLDRCDPSWCPFSISHPDLTTKNIIVDAADTSRIVAMLDWEGARIRPWWQRCCDLPFIREELSNPNVPSEALEFEALRKAWGNVLLAKDVPGLSEIKLGWIVGRLYLLVEGDYAAWSSVKDAVDSVMEWRLDWPESDPAFGPLDEFLRRHGADIPSDYDYTPKEKRIAE